MPRKRILIGGAAAILVALAAYLYVFPEEEKPIPVSREEFVQDVKGLDLPNLKGEEREEALRKLQESVKNMPIGVSAEEEQRIWADPDLMKAMLSLEPKELHKIAGPSSERFRKARMQRLERFFELTQEEQDAEIDRVLDMIESFERMYKLMGGKEKDLMTERIKKQDPSHVNEMVVEMLRKTDSEQRAKVQEASRRFFRRWQARKTRRAKMSLAKDEARARTLEEAGKRRPTEESEEIVVVRPVAQELARLKVGDAVTIANMAEPGRPPRMIVARTGKQLGELPVSKWMTYAEYLAEKRQIWAKVLELDPARDYLVIQATVK